MIGLGGTPVSQSLFKQQLQLNGIELNAQQIKQFEIYADMLVEWNQKINLTSITQIDEIYEKHFYDSILPSFKIKMQGALCDVGAGAGFPSIPLKILYPDLKITIIETLGKRVTFLNELVKALELSDVTCLHARAEECQELRESFDVVTARAVANLVMLAELCVPLVKVGGKFVVMKGSSGREELNESQSALKLLGCSVKEIFEESLSDGSKRINIECEKMKNTPSKYPRAFALMKKKPLRGV